MSIRDKSYGENYKPTLVDRFGIYLSHSKILKIVRNIKEPVHCLDIGCGYNAQLLCSLAPFIENGIGVDVKINSHMNNPQKLHFVEAPIELTFNSLQKKSFNLIVMNSVLEHFNDPLSILKHSYEHLSESGILIINVPTWLGKTFLELSAFQLSLSPAYEMDDHKMYYDKKDLWPLIVKAGFKPSKISMKYHKFGLNLFCTAVK